MMTLDDKTASSGPITATLTRDDWATVISIMRAMLRMMPDVDDLNRLPPWQAQDAARMGLRVCDVLMKLAQQVAPSGAAQHGATS